MYAVRLRDNQELMPACDVCGYAAWPAQVVPSLRFDTPRDVLDQRVKIKTFVPYHLTQITTPRWECG